MSLVNPAGRSAGHSVPNTYAQGKALGNVRMRDAVGNAWQSEVSEIELLRAEIQQMRVEAQERDERIERLEALLDENGIEYT